MGSVLCLFLPRNGIAERFFWLLYSSKAKYASPVDRMTWLPPVARLDNNLNSADETDNNKDGFD